MQLSFRKTLFLSLVCGLFSGTLLANSGEISLNSDVVRLAGDWSLGNGLEVEGAILHHEDRGNVASIAGMKFGDAGSEGLKAGIGLKLAYVDPDIDQVTIAIDPPVVISSPSGGALALGGKVRYVPPQYNRLSVNAYAWFAPDVLAFDKMDKYQEIGVSVGYNVIRDADVFVGYRNLKAGFKDFGDATLDTGMHVGIRVNF